MNKNLKYLIIGTSALLAGLATYFIGKKIKTKDCNELEENITNSSEMDSLNPNLETEVEEEENNEIIQ